MKSCCITIILLLSVCQSYSQTKHQILSENSDGIVIDVSFAAEEHSIISAENKKVIKYFNAIDEGNPGKPALPSKTFFIAIPPYSKVNVDLVKPVYTILKDVEVALNPTIVLNEDSTFSYKDAEPDKNSFSTDEFPSSVFEITGYVWIRDYYCVIIKVNTHIYNWKKREVQELNSTAFKINFLDIKPFNVNVNPVGDFDKTLDEVIINFSSAQKYRSFNTSSIQTDTTGNWIDYTKEYVKLGIANDGIYRIGYTDLVNYGINPASVNPMLIKIYIKGKQVPIYVSGEGDFSFDQNDYIEFWAEKNYGKVDYRTVVQTGQNYNNYMNRYSDTTTAWLMWEADAGLRTSIVNNNQTGLTDSVKYHQVKNHFEKDARLWYYDAEESRTQLPFWQEHKVWTWEVANYYQTLSFPFGISNAVPNTIVNSIARLISNQKYPDANYSPAHKFASGLNSLPSQDTTQFEYRQTINLTSEFSSNDLIDGSNSFKIYGLPTQFTSHRALVDWVDIDYLRYNFAVDDSLKIMVDPSFDNRPRVIQVNNVLSDINLLTVYKINNDKKKFLNLNKAGGNLYFADTVKGGDIYFVIKTSKTLSPIFYEKKQFNNLRDVSKGADYILLTSRILEQSTSNYKNFIASNYNFRVERVFVNDIYDEFNYGEYEPESIKRFLEYAASNWQSPAPSYLTIIGDANYDYKNVIHPTNGIIRKNIVPSYGFPVSDTWYTTIDNINTNIQRMYVGRISAVTNEDVEFYLQKHQTYLQRNYDDWNKKVILFSGGSSPGELQQIYYAHKNLFNNTFKPIPVGNIGTHFYKTTDPVSSFGPYTLEQVKDVIDNGSLVISYIGHSAASSWDNGITKVQDLKNLYLDRLPVVSDFGCSTGKFAEPDVDAFGELFTVQDLNGQAIAYISNSSWGYLNTSLNFPQLFYRKLLIDAVLSFGKAHALAKLNLINQYGNSETIRVFNYCNVLFGDPVIELKTPLKPNFEVNTNSFSLFPLEVNDQTDSVKIKIAVRNLGRTFSDSLDISIIENWNSQQVFSSNYKIKVPLYSDTLFTVIPVKNRVGTHNLYVELDKNNIFDELNEADNIASFQYIVYSTSLRPIQTDDFYSSKKLNIDLLNPSIKLNTPEQVLLSIADNPEFTNPQNQIIPFDTVVTKVNLNLSSNKNRFWWRIKVNSENLGWSKSFSFRNFSNNFNWFIDNSFNSEDVVYSNTEFNQNNSAWILTESENKLVVSSAGFSVTDGGTSIKFNDLETLPSTSFWGIATAILDTTTLEPKNFKYFDYTGNSNSQDSMINYLESLPLGTSTIMTICTDGWQPVLNWDKIALLRQNIKNFGSTKVDSIWYRDSWCMLGKKGAPMGSVPESFRKDGFGVASLEISKLVRNINGKVEFPIISNSAKWINLIKNDSLANGSNITFIPLGIKENNQIDTLETLSFTNNTASLEEINPNVYPKIKLIAGFSGNDLRQTPRLKSLGVNFIPLPELTTNYQVVSVEKDSIYQGDSTMFNFSVYNAGKSPADSFYVTVNLIKPNNNKRVLFNSQIVKLDSASYVGINMKYISLVADGYGSMTFEIIIDDENDVRELYEDNNKFVLPFYIKRDTTNLSVSEESINVSFDGNEIVDGDFVSANPIVLIKQEYPIWFPTTDTTAIKFYLNNNKINYSQFQIIFDNANRIATYKLNPNLADGEYSFSIYGVDFFGNMPNQPGFEKRFVVSNKLNAYNLYNYPNPFSDRTYFTFSLSKLPEQLNIKIFSIAGRLLKTLSQNSSQLRAGFNKIEWNGRDEDGDRIANGVYIYKLIIINADEQQTLTQKLVILR